MSRQEKRSRMRLLPPKIQLQQRDALTGSYPTNSRFSTDGRTGNYSTNFDDTKTINFTEIKSGLTAIEGTYGFEANLIHYQRWSSNEFVDTFQNEFRFKQTYVGTPFSADINEAIQNINDEATDNQMIVQMAEVDSKSIPDGPYPDIKAIAFTKDDAQYAYIDYYQTDPGANYKNIFKRPFSICVWIFPTIEDKDVEYPILFQGMFNAAEEILPQSVWQLLIIDERIEFRIYNQGKSEQYGYARTEDPILSQEWLQVCVTYDPNLGNDPISIYINQIEQTLETDYEAFTGFICQYEQLIVGRYYYDDGFNPAIDNRYVGLISEIFYTGKRLSIEEIGILDDALKSGVSIIDYTQIISTKESGYIPGIGLPESSIWLQQPDAQDILSLTGSSMYSATGSVKPNIIDGLPFIHFSPGQELTPFRDHAQPAVDGKSSNNPFFATGSAVTDVGEGFSGPLWSKNKIEIDLTPSIDHSVGISNNTSIDNNYPMMYWNNDSKTYEGIGTGKEFSNYLNTSLNGMITFLNEVPIGFGHTLDNGGVAVSFSTASYYLGKSISNFGFPMHPKFHGTGSNEISLSNYISEPFLVEKIVLYTSASLSLNNYFQLNSRGCVTTFFILNQRKGSYNSIQTINYYSSSNDIKTYSTGVSIPSTYNNSYIETTRDLVTYLQISKIPNTSFELFEEGMKRELNYVKPINPPGLQFTQQLVVSGTIKSPIQTSVSVPFLANTPGVADPNNTVTIIEKWNASGRRGDFSPNGRDYIGAVQGPNNIGQATIGPPGGVPSQYVVNINSNVSKTNPYILLPTDRLLLGWQVPHYNVFNNFFSNVVYNGAGPTLTFSKNGINKLILYGSYIREGREYNDGLNQLLSSDGIHEVIE